ncbi:MAG: 2-C-methyl-D-erythritol 4-phosphate cytidylyltransferase [Roseburia sp.]|nr:2-C-methyl-D-erythritol 4-phosphate cytidylyltransferase [Roseburia sp.]
MNIALILSGGSGSRLGGDIPKQYQKVKERPILSYCLDTFEKHTRIHAIQIVAGQEWEDSIRDWAGEKLKGFSRPGATRQLSIWNGLQDILKYACNEDVVIIHDGARPLVSSRIIEDCLSACETHDGALPVLPMKDTVYQGEGGRITSLLERQKLYAGQAPEAFVLGSYVRANQMLFPQDILGVNGSTEPAIMAGLDIALVDGDESNFKITTREDLLRFRQMMEKKI